MTRRRPKPTKREPSPLRPAAEVPAEAAAPPSRWVRLLSRFGVPAALLVIVAAAFAVRVLPAMPYIFPSPGQVRYFNPDSYYHVRHAKFAAEHGFRLQRIDPSVYPNGSPAFYAGLFDLTVAAVARVAGGGTASRDLVERVAPWVPAVLGALGVLAAFFIGRAAYGPLTGLAAALFLLVFPGTYLDQSMLGFVDHHVVEVLLGFLVLLGVARLLQVQHGPSPPSWRRPAVLHALPMALFLFSWYGAPIYIVLVVVTFFVIGSLAILRTGDAGAVAVATLRWFAGAAVVVAPIALLFPWLVMELRMMKAVALMAVPVAVGLPLYLRGATALVRRGVRRELVFAAMVGLALGSIFVLTALVHRAAQLEDLLLGVKTGFVQEQSDVSLARWWGRTGPILVLALAALPLALVDAWRRRDVVTRVPAVLMAMLVVGLWYKTHDYDYAAGAFSGVAAAIGLALLIDLVPRRRGWRAGAAVAALATIAALFWPLDKAQLRWPNQARLDGMMHLEEGVLSAMRFIRDRTPQLAAPLSTLMPERRSTFRHPKGNYGVMSFWDLGHYVAALANRPAVAIGALEGRTASWMIITDEEESVRALAAGLQPGEDLRYVVVDARTVADVFGTMVRISGGNEKEYSEPYGKADAADGRKVPIFTYGPKYRASMIYRLFFDPSGLAHYRLVFASPQKHAVAYVAAAVATGTNVVRRAYSLADPAQARNWQRMASRAGITRQGNSFIYDVAISSTARVYEKVLGARLTGMAAPGAKVEARLRLRARALGGPELAYHQETVADASGAYALVVPYPTGVAPDSDVEAFSPYEVMVNGQPVGRAQVGIEAVRGGLVVPVRETAR